MAVSLTAGDNIISFIHLGDLLVCSKYLEGADDIWWHVLCNEGAFYMGGFLVVL